MTEQRSELDQVVAAPLVARSAARNKAAQKKAAEKKRGVFYYLGLGLSAGLLGLVILLGLAVIVVPAATGSTPMTVLTGSMIPAYPPGTLIVVKPTPVEQIRLGDVLTYQIESGKPEVVTHRVVSVVNEVNGETTFITQGDNNPVADALAVRPVQIKGTVWYGVPWIGYLNNLITGEQRSWLVPVVAVGLFLYAGFMVASGAVDARKRRRQGAEQAAAEDAAAQP